MDKKLPSKYKVIVNRIAYSSLVIEVEAANKKEAKQKAIDMAGDLEFSEDDVDYDADWVQKA